LPAGPRPTDGVSTNPAAVPPPTDAALSVPVCTSWPQFPGGCACARTGRSGPLGTHGFRPGTRHPCEDYAPASIVGRAGYGCAPGHHSAWIGTRCGCRPRRLADQVEEFAARMATAGSFGRDVASRPGG